MALAPATIPVPADVADLYASSNAQTRMGVESMIRVYLSTPTPPSSSLTRHEQDLYAWAQEQAALLRQGTWHALDLEHLSEEIEDVAHSQQDKLASHLLVLLTHLLKLMVAAQRFPHDYVRAARGWRLTCQAQRLQVAKVLRRNASLRPTVQDEIADAYAIARLEAAAALATEEDAVPEACPWTPAKVLATDFWPDARQESHHVDTP
jgi:uncharacterized protein DUF29